MTAPTAPLAYTTRLTCRLCSSPDLIDLFSLGSQYPSTFLDSLDAPLPPKVPIDIVMCQGCTLVQQRHTAPQDFLYTRFYWYRSSVSDTMKKALREIVLAAEKLVELKPGDVVLDIGANDGELLSNYRFGVTRVAAEPATNLADECQKHCDVFIGDFWSAGGYYNKMNLYYPLQAEEERTRRRLGHQAKVVTAIGCFYDLESPNDFIADVTKVLAPDGVFIAQLMCLKQMLQNYDVGNLAHEHLEFYSLKALDYLLNKHGLEIFDIEENSVNGGSYRLFIRHTLPDNPFPRFGDGRDSPIRVVRVINARLEEMRGNYDKPDGYVEFRSTIETHRRKIHGFITDRVREGKRCWVYGASTKGNVLLQYVRLFGEPFVLGMRPLIEAAADRSPEKHGKYTVGTNIPIKSEEEFRAANPDYALLLPYAFLNEIREREKEWLDRGGCFVVPLPNPYVFGKGGGDAL